MPAELVEQNVLALIRNDLMRLRDDDKLHARVEDELRRLHGSRFDEHKVDFYRYFSRTGTLNSGSSSGTLRTTR